MGFGDEVERARSMSDEQARANAAVRRAHEREKELWEVVRLLGQDIEEYLLAKGVEPQPAETIEWITEGGPRDPTYRHYVEVPRGWRLGPGDGWAYVVTPEGVLNSVWNGPSGGRHVFRKYLRPLRIGTSVKEGDYWQAGRYSLNNQNRIMIVGDSETQDTELNSILSRGVARLTSS